MLKFCLVDDDPIFAMIVQSLVAKLFDYVEFVHYKNGEEALYQLSQLQEQDLPDLLLLDINMPLMNGWEFLEAFSQDQDFDFPIYLISSSIDPEDRSRAKNNEQVKELLEKPLNKEKLKLIVQNLQQCESA